MTEEKIEYVDVTVIQTPVTVDWMCPHCDHDHSVKYNDFLGGEEPCDWNYSKLFCEECDKECEVNSVDWD